MIETRAGFLKLTNTGMDPIKTVWIDRKVIRLIGYIGGDLAVSVFGHQCNGGMTWICYPSESIDEIFEAIERIDKKSSETQIVNTHEKEG